MITTGVIGFMITCIIALWANRRFAHLSRLPMQWGIDGRVNWSAPRHMALATIPLIYLVVAVKIYFRSEASPTPHSVNRIHCSAP